MLKIKVTNNEYQEKNLQLLSQGGLWQTIY